MTSRHTLVYTGKLQQGFTKETVAKTLVSDFRMKPETAEKLVRTEKPCVIKRGLSKEQAQQLGKKLQKAGLAVSLRQEEEKLRLENETDTKTEPNTTEPKTSTIKTKSAAQRQQKSEPAQAAGKSAPHTAKKAEKEGAREEKDNPYAAPSADLVKKKDAQGEWRNSPKKVPAGHGWQWFSSAIGIFFQEPWKLLGVVFVVTLITMLISLIPFIGQLLYYIPAMVFAGGFFLAAHDVAEGNPIHIKYAFAGWSHNRNQLLLLGIIYLCGMIAIGVVVFTLIAFAVGINFIPLFFGGTTDPGMASAAPSFILVIIIMLLALGLSIPVMMAVWFSVPLVALADHNALDAFKLSFQACLRNILPFLVYGLAIMVIGAVFGIAFAIITGIFGFFADGGFSVFAILLPFIFMLLLGLPFLVISGLSVYTGFTDIFSS